MSEECVKTSPGFSSIDSCPSASKENHILRLLSGITIIMVVYVHAGIHNYCLDFVVNIGKFAMPILFMTSGFYIYSKDGHAEKRIYSKVIRFLKLIILAKILYITLDGIFCLTGYYSLDYFIYGSITLSDYSTHLWFLYGMLLDYGLLAILYWRNIDFSKLYFLIPVLIGAYIVLTEVLPSIGYHNNAIIIGAYVLVIIAFFLLGNYVHRNWEKINSKISNTMIIAMIIIGVILSGIESVVFYEIFKGIPFNNIYVGSVLLTVGLFIGSFRVSDTFLRVKWLEYLGQNLMGVIYIIHFGILMLLTIPFENYDLPSWYPFAKMLIALAVSTLISYAIFKTTHKNKQKRTSESGF